MFCLLGGSGSVGCGLCFQGNRDPSTCHPCPLRALLPPQLNCSAKLQPPRVVAQRGTPPVPSDLALGGDFSSYPQLSLLPKSYVLFCFSFLKSFCFVLLSFSRAILRSACNPMDCCTPASLAFTISQSFAQTHVPVLAHTLYWGVAS